MEINRGNTEHPFKPSEYDPELGEIVEYDNSKYIDWMDNTVKPEIERLGGVFDELEDIKADMKIL